MTVSIERLSESVAADIIITVITKTVSSIVHYSVRAFNAKQYVIVIDGNLVILLGGEDSDLKLKKKVFYILSN